MRLRPRSDFVLVLALVVAAQERALPVLGQTTAPPARRRAARPPSSPIVSKTVVLTPFKDNTLFQTSDGSLSNGAGIHLFAGTTAGFQLRRALIAFDVAAAIPPGSTITHVTLVLHESQSVAGTELMELHRVTADWGQGSSDSGAARDGGGSPPQPGDATWIHTFFPDRRWTTPGGDFAAAADSTVAAAFGDFTWGSSATMTARVQDWLDHPSTNFGWIVIGNEGETKTAKRFDSREVVPASTRPTLTIDFNTRL
ncbi:MAG: hypothetical protein QOK37_3230 [Thermoanaerobaculia bacterium]|jgi:hypothetical protein|nr:hypothetical protein [Thermoanaerobaculia bacterium]